MKYFIYMIIAFFSLTLTLACNTKQLTTNKKQIDTIVWDFPPMDLHKRMFYGPVKKSIEQMYYVKNDINGKIKKTKKKYYKTGNIFQHNYSIEFDSLGRRKKYIIYAPSAGKSKRGGPVSEEKDGILFFFDKFNNEIKEITINQTKTGKWYEYATIEKYYDIKGNNNSIRSIRHFDQETEWTIDSSAFKYNEKGLMIDSEFYTRDWVDEPEIQERAFGEEPIDYEYDNQGRVIKKTRKKGATHHYFYKDSVLYRETDEFFGRTNEYIYYPNGVYKSAKLRNTLVTGDFEFLKTGDITTYNGQKVADYSEYDQYGNWTIRIMNNQHGSPESYTERKIEYYE